MLELNSRIPGPVTDYGRSIPREVDKKYAIYNGQPLTAFLWANGGDTFKVREFLKANAIGSAFTDLEEGDRVVIEIDKSFTQHPDY